MKSFNKKNKTTLNLDIRAKNVNFYIRKIFVTCLKIEKSNARRMPEIENYPQDDTRCVIIYIAGYTCCNNEGIDDTFLYYEKYFQKPLIKRVEYLR